LAQLAGPVVGHPDSQISGLTAGYESGECRGVSPIGLGGVLALDDPVGFEGVDDHDIERGG